MHFFKKAKDPLLPESKTNTEKVKREIQEDISAGQGDITAREAGSYRKKK